MCPWPRVEAIHVAGNSGELPKLQRCWPWSWWKRPWSRSSLWVVSTRPTSGQELDEGWRSTDTFGRLQNSVSSIALGSVPPVGPAHQLCLTVGNSPPPQEAISCQRRHPACDMPIGSSCCLAGQPWWTQIRAETPVAEGVSENLPLGHCSHVRLILRPQTGLKEGDISSCPSCFSQCLWEVLPCGILVGPQSDVFQSTIDEKSD